MTSRGCRVCLIDLPIEEFGLYKTKDRPQPSRRRKMCKSCCRKAEAARYRDNPSTMTRMKDRAWAYNLKAQYGITADEYHALVKKQNGKCRICSKKSVRRLNVDHCHTTGAVRGLLCWNCNIAIGYFKDSTKNLQAASTYLGSEAPFDGFCSWLGGYLENVGRLSVEETAVIQDKLVTVLKEA